MNKTIFLLHCRTSRRTVLHGHKWQYIIVYLMPLLSRGGGVEYGQKWQYIIEYLMPLLSREGVGELLVILGYLASCDTIIRQIGMVAL